MNKGKAALYGLVALSLGANVFFAGMIVGQGPHKGDVRPRPPRHEGGLRFNVGQLDRLLSDEGREKARSLLFEQRRTLQDKVFEHSSIKREVRALLKADVVDIPALKAALDRHSELMSNLTAPVRTIILDVIAQEPLEVRQKVAEELFKRRRRPDRRRHRRLREGDLPPPPPEHDPTGAGKD